MSPFAPPFPSFAPAPAFDGIDESTTARPAGSTAQPVAPAAPFAPPIAPPVAFPPPVAPAAFAPPSAPFAPPVPPAPAAVPNATMPFPPAPASPSEFPSYTLPAPPGYAIEDQTTAPLPPAYGTPAPSGPQFSYEPYRTTGRTFIATWLFAMLLGFWGADRFYLGKIGTAIAKLLTLGGLGVWVLVDLLLVLTGAQRDRDGRPLEGYDEHKRTAWIVTGALVGLSVLTSIVSGIASLLVR
ncbi:hypothetical protein ASE14_08635 [Agromyces sp. Root81]|nr:hypothetical protein ASE14_08635 [Agromyces sp. Root81]